MHNNRATTLLGVVLSLLTGLLLIAPAFASVKSQLPDVYSEPGLNPFRDQVSEAVAENVDPFSGALTLVHTDLVIPGDGGFDIKIQRSYNSNNVYLSRKSLLNVAPNLSVLLPRTPWGLGWTLHMGRVLRSDDTSIGRTADICTDGGTGDDTLNNAILELPDGSQQVLFVNNTSFSRFITKEQWVANCITGGLEVISPNGTHYRMDRRFDGGSTYTDNLDRAWYPSRITDRNGNYLDITYNSVSSGKDALISGISASDGRSVTFGYSGSTATTIQLSSISTNGQTWYYGYTAVSGVSGGYQHLTSVTRPDSSQWRYAYWSRSAGAAGDKVLQTMTHPYGGTATFDYGYRCFMPISCSTVYDTFNSLVVTSRTTGGTDVASGTWNYSYAPSTTEDVTTVTFPGGSYRYTHYGSMLVFGGSDIPGQRLWHLGLLKQKEVYNGSTLVRRETYTWQPSAPISGELYKRPPYDGSQSSLSGFSYADNAVYMPVLTQKVTYQDGTNYTTTYSNFDASNNPRTITETGQASRTTNLTYFPRTAGQNIVRLVKDEEFSGYGTKYNTYRTFDGAGNPTQVTRQGVTDYYTYFTNGNVNTHRNGRQINGQPVTWTYSNYFRGIPQSETHPESISISRVVNSTGTIQSETNGRQKTTSYAYDGMNRIRSITRPLNAAINVSWPVSGGRVTSRVVTRGGYSQTTTFDGFGRPSYVNTSGITRDTNYDALGYKSYESDLSSTTGHTYTTDVLGRVRSATHGGDGTSRIISFPGNNVMQVRNERQYTTTYTYRSYGDPDQKLLMRIDAPENVSTVFTRNIVGQPETISQNNVTRSYTYFPSNRFLQTETNPETGTTTYGRDEVGNMTSRQVGSSGIAIYTYDGLNRLRHIDYPGSTPDVDLGYDNNNNLALVANSNATRTLVYDDNDNRRTDTLTVGGVAFGMAYGYDTLDHLSTVTYPSLRQVSYAPDVLGRPTSAMPYVNTNSVTHWPNGVLQGFTYANGHVTSITEGPRQWISSISANRGGTYAVNLGYGYDGLANVTSITNSLDSSDSKSLTYDGLDRLRTAGSATIDYSVDGDIQAYTTSAGTLTYTYGSSNNRLESIGGYRNMTFGYDAYGNVTSNGSNTFAYNDAGDLTFVTGATPAEYKYDGKNHRVSVTKSNGMTIHLYGEDGMLYGEYDANGTWKKEFVYLGQKLAATIENVPDIAPEAPSSITVPTSSTNGTFAVTWGSATGTVTRYELQEATDSAFTTTSTAYSGTALTTTIADKPNGTYYYRVRACNGTACSAFRTGANGVAVTSLTPSVPPAITVPANNYSGSYAITWSRSTGTVGRYELQEANNSSFTGATIVYSGTGDFSESASATVSGKTNGTYYYRVRACNDNGCSAYRAGANGVVVTVLTPGIPASITVPASAHTTYTISWGAASGSVSYYELQEGIGPLPSGITADQAFSCYRNCRPGRMCPMVCRPGPIVYSGTNRSVTLSKAWTQTYIYRVRACNQYGCGGYRLGGNAIVVTVP